METGTGAEQIAPRLSIWSSVGESARRAPPLSRGAPSRPVSRVREVPPAAPWGLSCHAGLHPHALAAVQQVEAGALQGADADEDILPATVGGDEPEALVGAEELHDTLDRIAIRKSWFKGGRRCIETVNARDLRPLGPVLDITDKRGAWQHIAHAGPFNDRNVKESVWRAVVEGNEAEALRGVEPFHRGGDPGLGGPHGAERLRLHHGYKTLGG